MADLLEQRMAEIERLATQLDAQEGSREAEIERLALGGLEEDAQPQATPLATPPNALAGQQGMGMWAQGMQQARQVLSNPATYQEQEAQALEAQEPGVPMDVRSGAGALTRLRLGARRNRMHQLSLLRGLYGDEAVRMDKQGNWIVRTTDEAGAPKDLLVDEDNITLKDFADVAHKAPALALSIMSTKGIPAASIFKSAVMGALGWAGGEAATDVASRVGSVAIEPGEIATTRGAQALTDVALGYGAGRAINAIGTLGRLLRMASSETPRLLDEGATLAARQRVEQGRQVVKEATGVTLQPTLGELTGNPVIQRLEAFFSNIPLARGFILHNIERRMANERAIQTELLKMGGGGSADVPDATRLGEEVLTAIGGKLQGLTQQADELAGSVRREATGALTDPLADISGGALSHTRFGQRMQRRGEAQLQHFKSEAARRYDAFRNLPEATEPRFDAMPIQERAITLKDELIKSAGGDVEKALAPTGIVAQLDAVDRLPSDQSYFDLVKLRDAIYDRIGSPEPISGRGERILKDLGASVTREMQGQGPKVFGPNWKLVEEAITYYRENVESFYQKGIAGMLKPRTEAGAIDPERIAGQLLAGGKGSVTAYNTFRDFFTKGGAVQDMNRLLRDELIDRGTDKATGLVRLEDMGAAVSKLEPEIVRELYGVAKQDLLREVQQAQTGLRIFGKAGAVPERGTQAVVEANALKEALATGQLKSGKLKALAATTAELERSYTTELTRALQQGDTRLIEAAPEKFVRNFLLNPATTERAAQNAMQHLTATGDDLLVGDVRRLYLADLFKAGAANATGDVQQLVSMQTGSPLRNLDPQKFAIVLENEAVQKRMNLVLGPEVAGAVREFGIAMSGRAGRDAAATTTGAFAGGSYFHNVMQLLGGKWGALKSLPDLAQYRVLSYLMTHPSSINSLRTVANAVPDQLDDVVKAMTLSPEFAHALASDSATPEEAAQVTREIQAWAQPQR